MEQPNGFETLVATVAVIIAEEEYRAAIVRQEPLKDNNYFLMTQRGKQYQQFESPDDISAIKLGMTLIGLLLIQEVQENQKGEPAQ